MRTRAARGDIGGALKAYKALWDLLDVDYDIEPSQETQGLVVEIKQMPSLGQEPEALTLAPSLPNALRETAARKRLFVDSEPGKACSIEGQLDVMYSLPKRSPRALLVAFAPE